MKKYAFFVISVMLLLTPFHLHAEKLAIKMSFGLASGGQVEGQSVSTTGFFGYQAAEPEKAGQGMEYSLELIYQLNPNFGLSLGFGFMNRSMKGHTGIFTDDQVMLATFWYEPKFTSEIYPVSLSGIFSFPLSDSFSLSILGGLGYYFGKTEVTEPNKSVITENPNYFWHHFTWIMQSNINTIGYHAGGGIDIKVGGGLIITLEAVYRIVSFKDFETSVVQNLLTYNPPEGLWGDSSFLYAQQVGGDVEMGDMDYTVSNLNLTGMVLKAGFKLRF
jgi:opacity protein-like surface antigen